jgi:hypothetical protein
MFKTNWLIGLVIISACFTNINAQDNCPVSILPVSGSLKSWGQKTAPECFSSENLFEAIDGAAEVYLEYGVASMARSSYSRKKQTLDIEVYQMADTDAAFGILSNMNDEPLPDQVNGSITILRSYYGMAAKGKYFMIVTEPTGKGGLETEINKVILDMTGRIQENLSFPDLISKLQIKDITRSVLFKGDIVLNNLIYLGISRPFQYEYGIYFESKGIPFVVFTCMNDMPLSENIYSTLERFKESGKYTIDHQKNSFTNTKGSTFQILTEGKIIILVSDDFQNTIAGTGFKFWKD